MLKKFFLAVALLAAILVAVLVRLGIVYWRGVFVPMRDAAASFRAAASIYAAIPQTTLSGGSSLDARTIGSFEGVAASLSAPYGRLSSVLGDASRSHAPTQLGSLRQTAQLEFGVATIVFEFAKALRASGLGTKDYEACAIAAHIAARNLSNTDEGFARAWNTVHDESRETAVGARLADLFNVSDEREAFETADGPVDAHKSLIEALRQQTETERVNALGVIDMTPVLEHFAADAGRKGSRHRR